MPEASPLSSAAQLDLFEAVLASYPADGSALSNAELYRRVSTRMSMPMSAINERTAIGSKGEMHSPVKRAIRWTQQSLRALSLLTHDESGGRGVWRLTSKGTQELTPATPRIVRVAFSTKLGVALWAAQEDVFASLGEPVHLVFTSPPFPLHQPRAYGNVPEAAYVDWLCEALEPIVRHLTPGGSICLNISNDIFLKKSPARSLYQERLAIAMHDRLGMFKMDMIPWVNPSRPPGPMQWASRTRQQLNYTWDPIWWFSNDPVRCLANNRRVLEPHTPKHAALQARGGEDRTTRYGDGSYRLREGSYGKPTAGRIPRNLITRSHKCWQTNLLRAAAKAQGLPMHGATMPVDVCRQIIDFLTKKDDLVVDPFSGWFKTAKAAQQAGRRWIGTELMGEYALGAAAGFTDEDGFQSFGSRA